MNENLGQLNVHQTSARSAHLFNIRNIMSKHTGIQVL